MTSLVRVILTRLEPWDAPGGGPMQLRLSDPSYTDRLATFLRSLGQTAIVAAPGRLELNLLERDSLVELGFYLRVWTVLYPDARVQLENAAGDLPPT